MAVSHVGTGTPAFGATSASPAYSGTISAGDTAYMGVVASPSTVTISTPSGWTQVSQFVSGSGTSAASSGARKHAVFKKAMAGGETGTVSTGTVTGANIVGATITVWRVAAGQTLEEAVETGNDTSAGTNLSVTAGSVIGETAGDVMLGFVTSPANSNMGSSTFNATGATYGTAVEHADAGNTTGDDARIAWVSRPISSGTASAATVFTSTISATVTGGVTFLRLREVAGSSDQTVSPSGIASAEAFGTPTFGITVSPSGIASAEAFGTPSRLDIEVRPSGIASTEAFGSPVIDSGGLINPVGIASAEAFGVPRLDMVVSPVGIASAEAFGGLQRIDQEVRPAGIISQEAFGAPTIEGGAQAAVDVRTRLLMGVGQ